MGLVLACCVRLGVERPAGEHCACRELGFLQVDRALAGW